MMNERVKALVEKEPTKIFGPNLEQLLNSAGFYRQRKWHGLTDAEISAIEWRANETLDQYARHIEAKLKEKNA